ncbi:MAG TPA: IPT/TIG domain-containing protein [Verrucomicrobiae bacterium]|nr:IPT/TIG domain-containing protein [Verrucomicrobiae bacterium]
MNRRFLLSVVATALSLAGSFAAPVITSFSPHYASSGDPFFVTIQGSGFTGGALDVRFNNVRDTTATATGDGWINARVPAGAPLGPGPISVKVGNNQTFSAEDFVVIGPGPYLHSFSPGGGNSGTSVTLTGAHFNPVGSLVVRFGGRVATPTSSADQVLVVPAPPGVTTGYISVTRGGSSFTNDTLFYVNPVITSFSPAFGRAGTNITIRGTNFTDTTQLRIGGIPVTSFWVTNNNVIGAIIPQGAVTGTIRIDTPAANPAITATNFVVQPTVHGFTPNFGFVGTSVTVTGANFNVAGLQVRFGSVPSPNVTAVTFGSLTATVPNGAVTAPITVTTSQGSNTSAQLFYMPPRIFSFAPTNGPAGTIISIVGTNLLGATAVAFNGVPSPNFWVTNNGSMGAEVPPNAVTGPIQVTTPHSTTNSSQFFYALPIISGFTPANGLPGTNVIVHGTNFTGTTAVTFNGTAAAFSVTNGILEAVVPTNATTGPIAITSPAGTMVSGQIFTLDYTSDLQVGVVAPASRVLGGDFTYVITISNRGPFAVSGVMLTNLLPGSVALKSASSTQGAITTGNPVRVSVGSLNVNARAVITLTVTPQATGVIENVATVAGGFPDPTSTNNTSVTHTTIFVVPVVTADFSSANQIRIAWPSVLNNFVLQSASDISNSNEWATVQTEPEFIGDQKVVTEPIGSGSKFYRLRVVE